MFSIGTLTTCAAQGQSFSSLHSCKLLKSRSCHLNQSPAREKGLLTSPHQLQVDLTASEWQPALLRKVGQPNHGDSRVFGAFAAWCHLVCSDVRFMQLYRYTTPHSPPLSQQHHRQRCDAACCCVAWLHATITLMKSQCSPTTHTVSQQHCLNENPLVAEGMNGMAAI